MVERLSPENERRLADRLRREAEDRRPEFSESLHQRIVEATTWHKVQPRPAAFGRPELRAWLGAALAVGIAVVATVGVWQYVHREAPQALQPRETAVLPPGEVAEPETGHDVPPVDVEQSPLDPLDAVAGGTAETVGNLVDATLRKSQWAYLDHDARLAADLMLAQLPLDLELLEGELEQ